LSASGSADLTNAVLNSTGGAVSVAANGGALNMVDGKVTAADDIALSAGGAANLNNATLSTSGGAVSAVAKDGELALGAGSVTAADDITLSADRGGLSVSAGGSLVSTGGNITLSGATTTSRDGVLLGGQANNNVIVNASSGTVLLNGASATGAGVRVDHVQFTASQAGITGTSVTGNGFSLTNTSLSGSLADLSNVTLSSAGSGGAASNIIDNSIVNDASRENLLNKDIGSLTTVDMNGEAIFGDSTAAWDEQYGTASNPDSGWIFNNTIVNAGSANLSGVGFTDSIINIHDGDLTIANNGTVALTGTDIDVTNGSLSLSAKAGGISLTGSTVNVTDDISLRATRGDIALNIANMTSGGGIDLYSGVGNISLANSGLESGNDISLHTVIGSILAGSVNISAAGDILLTAARGDTGLLNATLDSDSGSVTVNASGNVNLNNANLSAENTVSASA
ncbi:TPA: hypothetical protein JLI26_004914, partial [Escherichia coli]|nr:hypothetical protein [Escherichia coli]